MKRFLTYLIIVLIFFIIGLLMANFLLIPMVVRKGEEVSVPNVCNLPLDSATMVLKKAGLQSVVTERRYDQIIEQGRIIIQEPLPDTKVKKGRIINLSVSLGPEKIVVPALSGLEFAKAKQIIDRLGLMVGDIDTIFSDSIGEGRVIQTVPEPETEVKKGDAIKIILSKGILLKTPNLVGLKIDSAKVIIKNLNLILGSITEVEGTGEKGTIIVQNPQPDQLVNKGDTINLMVVK
jgi:serine/threonine-protein kinase|uniref:PASTA domain-containing protein n=1 Tax=candidate division WOR-3 bacterium TaxID=2052148 RepID=A0A7C6AGM4_UNCW3